MNKGQQFIFMGRLGKNPELKYTRTSKPICYLSVAINNNESITTWKNVKVWGKQAEYANQFLKKGSDVFISGREEERSYRDKDGEIKAIKEINAYKIGFTNI